MSLSPIKSGERLCQLGSFPSGTGIRRLLVRHSEGRAKEGEAGSYQCLQPDQVSEPLSRLELYCRTVLWKNVCGLLNRQSTKLRGYAGNRAGMAKMCVPSSIAKANAFHALKERIKLAHGRSPGSGTYCFCGMKARVNSGEPLT